MDQFTASAFFPEWDDNHSKLSQSIQSKLPVFSKDTSETGAKTFFACGYEYFCSKLYRNTKMRNVYEVLQYNKPTKIYLDFDLSTEESDVDEFNNDFEEFMNACVNKLDKIYEDLDAETIECTIMDASTDRKHSKHVVIQVAFGDLLQVKEFVETVLADTPCPAVDVGVYTRNRCFRILHSTKMGKDTPLRLEGHKTEKYDPAVVFKSLIQAIPPPHYKGPFEVFPLKVRTFIKPSVVRKRYRFMENTSATAVQLDELPKGVTEYIKALGGTIRSAKADTDKPILSLIVSGVQCMHVCREHKSNNQFFGYNRKYMVGWWRCSDDDCPKISCGKVKLGWGY